MSVYDLMPYRKRGENVPARRGAWADPFAALQERTNRLFENFFNEFGLAPFGRTEDFGDFTPVVDISENNKEIKITAEVPGMDEKDIELELHDDALVIKGQKKKEEETEDERSYRREISYGSFERTIPLSCRVDADKAEAKFKNGLLRIKLPKSEPEEEKGRKIKIKHE